MKLVIFLSIFVSLKAFSQDGDAIIGKWLKANKEDLIIEVYKSGGEYKGKINWSKNSTEPAGYIMLDKLVYRAKEKKWKGIIHDPKSGRKYNATVVMNEHGSLEVRASVAFFTIERVFKRIA